MWCAWSLSRECGCGWEGEVWVGEKNADRGDRNGEGVKSVLGESQRRALKDVTESKKRALDEHEETPDESR